MIDLFYHFFLFFKFDLWKDNQRRVVLLFGFCMCLIKMAYFVMRVMDNK